MIYNAVLINRLWTLEQSGTGPKRVMGPTYLVNIWHLVFFSFSDHLHFSAAWVNWVPQQPLVYHKVSHCNGHRLYICLFPY